MLKEILKKDEIAAMKARDKARVSVLRLVNSEIKAYEVNNREDIPDENVIKIIEKSIKQTKEALEYAVKANNEEKIAEGKFALEVLTPYLPKQLTEEEVNEKLAEIAQAYGRELEELKAQLPSLAMLKEDLKVQKAVDFIVEKSVRK